MTAGASMGDYAEAYKDVSGQWRTRVKAGNHEVIFDSAESYTHKIDALAMLRTRFPAVPVVELDEDAGDEEPNP